MGNFREHNRKGSYNAARGDSDRFSGRGNGGFSGRSSSGFGGNRFGGNRGGFGNRGRGNSFGNNRPEMHDVTCSKCGKQCQVPFRPTGAKPVMCSDCFRQNPITNNFTSRNASSSGQGMSQEQFKQINEKLDKILEALEGLEVEVVDDEEEEQEE